MEPIKRTRWILTREGADGRTQVFCGLARNYSFRYFDEIGDAPVKTYISEKKALSAYDASWGMEDRTVRAVKVTETIEEATHSEASPARKGHWIDEIDCGCVMHKCSECGARTPKGFYEYENPNIYCYRCGARMKDYEYPVMLLGDSSGGRHS